MATWGDLVEVVNRTSKPLNVRFDGQDITLEPNYTAEGKERKDVKNFIPRTVVPFAKAQNILMGSENPIDVTDYVSLVGVRPSAKPDGSKKKRPADDISYLEQDTTQLTRVNLRDMLADDPTVKDIRVGRGPHRMAEAAIPQMGNAGMLAQEPL